MGGTGIRAPDTHRVSFVSLNKINELIFYTAFEFEIEVIVKAAGRESGNFGPCQSYYAKGEARVSLSGKTDFTRIGLLHTGWSFLQLFIIIPRGY